ncbi:hypothetical protein ACRAWD_17735 [Caulobacter segnis]
MVMPHVEMSGPFVTLVVAVFGTTISPYLFFWQSAEEVGGHGGGACARPASHRQAQGPGRVGPHSLGHPCGDGVFQCHRLLHHPDRGRDSAHRRGHEDIQTSAQAAEALNADRGPPGLRPVWPRGDRHPGLLAVPVLAGSAAYAVAEARRWTAGLEHPPWRADGSTA